MPLIPVAGGNPNDPTPAAGVKVDRIDLALIDPQGLPVGTPVVDTSGNAWTLTESTATVDHTTTEAVAGCPSLRWIQGGGGGGGGSGGGFGSDTLVALPNSTPANVTALELVTTLSTATAGAEVSHWVVKLLNAGAQTTALDIKPLQTLFPVGAAAAPGVSFQGMTSSGFYHDAFGTAISVSVGIGGTQHTLFDRGTVNQMQIIGRGLFLTGDGGEVVFGSQIIADGTFTSRALALSPQGTVLGMPVASGRLATSAVKGFVYLQGSNGVPAGTPAFLDTGKIPCCIDDVTGTGKFWAYINGTWRGVALA